MEKEQKKSANEQNKDASVQPDPETLHTTDPQDHMKGPLSSLIQGVKHTFENDESGEKDDKEDKKED